MPSAQIARRLAIFVHKGAIRLALTAPSSLKAPAPQHRIRTGRQTQIQGVVAIRLASCTMTERPQPRPKDVPVRRETQGKAECSQT
eukprot:scaffold8085_cov127-Isochrysis_galbana.AAC.4